MLFENQLFSFCVSCTNSHRAICVDSFDWSIICLLNSEILWPVLPTPRENRRTLRFFVSLCGFFRRPAGCGFSCGFWQFWLLFFYKDVYPIFIRNCFEIQIISKILILNYLVEPVYFAKIYPFAHILAIRFKFEKLWPLFFGFSEKTRF